MKIPRKSPIAPYQPIKPVEPSKTRTQLKTTSFDCSFMSLLNVIKKAREMGIKDGEFYVEDDRDGNRYVIFGKSEMVMVDNPGYDNQMVEYERLLIEYSKKKTKYDEDYAIYQKELKEYLEWNKAVKIEEAKNLLRQYGEKL